MKNAATDATTSALPRFFRRRPTLPQRLARLLCYQGYVVFSEPRPARPEIQH